MYPHPANPAFWEALPLTGSYYFGGLPCDLIDKTLYIHGCGKLDDWAWAKWEQSYGHRTFTQVYIRPGCTGIGDHAFDPSFARNLEIWDELNPTYYWEFEPSLKYVYIPSSVTEIGEGAFQNCTCSEDIFSRGLDVEIDDADYDEPGLDKIGANAFRDSSLCSIDMPNTVTEIGEGAFRNCKRLTEAALSGSLRIIGREAFAYCPITKIELYGDDTEIADGAFQGCRDLEEVELYGVKRIGVKAFYGCGLKKIGIFPDTVTEIGESAFQDCNQTEEIILYNGLKTIGPYAFDGDYRSIEVDVPSTVTEIGERAFGGIEEIYYSGDAKDDGNDWDARFLI